MEYKGFKVGDTIRISNYTGRWSDRLNSNYPGNLGIKYPLIGTIEAIEKDKNLNFVAMSACNYGWDLNHLIENNVIKKMEEELKISKEKVLKAASTCNEAKVVLKVLFPEAFEEVYPVETLKLHIDKDWIRSGREGFRCILSSSMTIGSLSRMGLCDNYSNLVSIESKQFCDFYEEFCKWMNSKIK